MSGLRFSTSECRRGGLEDLRWVRSAHRLEVTQSRRRVAARECSAQVEVVRLGAEAHALAPRLEPEGRARGNHDTRQPVCSVGCRRCFSLECMRLQPGWHGLQRAAHEAEEQRCAPWRAVPHVRLSPVVPCGAPPAEPLLRGCRKVRACRKVSACREVRGCGEVRGEGGVARQRGRACLRAHCHTWREPRRVSWSRSSVHTVYSSGSTPPSFIWESSHAVALGAPG